MHYISNIWQHYTTFQVNNYVNDHTALHANGYIAFHANGYIVLHANAYTALHVNNYNALNVNGYTQFEYRCLNYTSTSKLYVRSCNSENHAASGFSLINAMSSQKEKGYLPSFEILMRCVQFCLVMIIIIS